MFYSIANNLKRSRSHFLNCKFKINTKASQARPLSSFPALQTMPEKSGTLFQAAAHCSVVTVSKLDPWEIKG